MTKMTKKDFRKRSEYIIKKLCEEVLPLEPGKKSERLKESENDFITFCNTYLPHYAADEFAPFHHDIIASFEKRDKVVSPSVFAAPRGFGKTTVIFCYVLYCILFKKRKFIVYISASFDLASDFTEFIKLEFQYNERIRQDFGRLIPSDLDNTGGADFVVNQIRVFSRGKKQVVRGFKYRNNRPDLIVIDDLEKDEESVNPKVVNKYLKIIKEAIYPSIGAYGSLLIIGTILGKKSVLGKILLTDDEPFNIWHRKIYAALYFENGIEKSLFPAKWSVEDLQKIKLTIGIAAFNKEYQNNPQDDECSLFQESWIKYFLINSIAIKNLKKVMFIDPSAGKGENNDYKAIITVGLDSTKMKYYVLNAWIKRVSILDLIYATYRLYKEYTPYVVGFESNAFQSVLKVVYNLIAKEMGYYLPLRLIDHREAKELRVTRISPFVEQSHILFKQDPGDDTPVLVEQLIYYPSSVVHDDGPDALSEAINMLSQLCAGKSSFTPIKRKKLLDFRGYAANSWK